MTWQRSERWSEGREEKRGEMLRRCSGLLALALFGAVVSVPSAGWALPPSLETPKDGVVPQTFGEPEEPQPGEPVNGLRLTVTTDKSPSPWMLGQPFSLEVVAPSADERSHP